jgi:type IX secretion system PorP/SprF family membrane protein
MNGFLLNPAMAGTVSYVPVCLTVRQQWMGIKGAPQTVALSGHTLLGRAEGVGGYLFNDNYGPIMRTGMLASFAHHLRVGSKQKIAFGVSLSAFQYTLDETKLDFGDGVQDATVGAPSKESAFVPDANFGVYFYQDERFFAGASVAQLFQWNIKVGTTNQNKMVRHYFLLGGYRFDINKDFKVEPSVLGKATESSPVQFDINCKGYYKKNYWLGVSYRTDNSIIALLGVKYQIYYFGYAYDYTLSKISNYTSGSHEIVIGVNIGEKENRGSSLL